MKCEFSFRVWAVKMIHVVLKFGPSDVIITVSIDGVEMPPHSHALRRRMKSM